MKVSSRFQPGHQLSKGRPKGSKNKVSKNFLEALENVAEEKQMSLYEHFVRRAYEDDTVLIAVMKKILPDKLKEESTVTSNNFVIDMIQRAKSFNHITS